MPDGYNFTCLHPQCFMRQAELLRWDSCATHVAHAGLVRLFGEHCVIAGCVHIVAAVCCWRSDNLILELLPSILAGSAIGLHVTVARVLCVRM